MNLTGFWCERVPLPKVLSLEGTHSGDILPYGPGKEFTAVNKSLLSGETARPLAGGSQADGRGGRWSTALAAVLVSCKPLCPLSGCSHSPAWPGAPEGSNPEGRIQERMLPGSSRGSRSLTAAWQGFLGT